MKQTVFKLPLVIGVAGGTASGKTKIVERIIENFNTNAKKRDRRIRIVHLEMHSFYKELDDDAKRLLKEGKYNFDHPDAIDFDLCANTVEKMINNEPVKVAKYDMISSSVVGYDTVDQADVIIIEGILLLYDERVRRSLGVKLFVERSAELRLRSRLEKYVSEYKRSPLAVIQQYTEFVKPGFEEFCRPTKKFADVIIPRGTENIVATNLIAKNLQEMFRKMVVFTRENADSINIEDENGINNLESIRRPVSRPH